MIYFQIFELLLSFCAVNGLRCVICRSLVETTSLQHPAQYKVVLSHAQLTEPFLAVVHWAGQAVDTHDVAPLLAIDFLKELYQVHYIRNLLPFETLHQGSFAVWNITVWTKSSLMILFEKWEKLHSQSGHLYKPSITRKKILVHIKLK